MILKSLLCSRRTVRPSSIRSLVLPDWAFSQMSSSSVHTFIGIREMSASPSLPQTAHLLSINLICANGEWQERNCEMRRLFNLKLIFLNIKWKGYVLCQSHRNQYQSSVLENRTFRNELQWAAEYSEAGQTPGRPIVYELMSKSISTFPTLNLEVGIINMNHVLCISIKLFLLASLHFPAPYMLQASPHAWTRCFHGWSLWRLAREKSARTWNGWRTTGGCIWSTRRSLVQNTQETIASTYGSESQ